MLKTKPYYFFLICIIGLYSCDEPVTFGPEHPFAVMAKKYRDPQEAIKAKAWLEEKGAEPYLMYFDTETEGRWHGIFLGAYPSLESMMKGKIDYEDQLGLTEAERINYNQINGNVLPFDYENSINSQAVSPLARLDSGIYSVLKRLPYQTENRLLSLKAIQQMDGNAARTQAVSRYIFDFPRGIKPLLIYQNASAMVEANYKSDFSYQYFNIQVIKLLPNHKLGNDIATSIANRILDTREYDYEESTAFSSGDLQGLTVIIKPREDRTMQYLVLTDSKQEFLYILQSRAKFFPLPFLKEMCKLLNHEQNATKLPKIHQALSVIPTTQSDSLVAFTYQRILPNAKGEMNHWTGNDEATYYFYKEATGFWKTNLKQFSDATNASKVYKKTVLDYKFKSKQEAVTVDEKKAVVLLVRRRKKKGRGTTVFPEELRFKRKNTIGTISNRKKAWLNKEQLQIKANAFLIE